MASIEASGQQARFLKGIEDIIPTNSTLVSELADVLEISTDSAYRRLRGDTLLTIDEIVTLCEHYKLSFDVFNKVNPGNVTFSYLPLEPTAESFAQYLEGLLKELNIFLSAKESRIIFACQDIPDFHHFNYPDLANFKIFYWMRTIMNMPDLSRIKFDADFQIPELLEIGKMIYEAYLKIDSIEVWTESTIKSTLKQIRFYWESGVFDSKDDALRVCAALSKQIDDIQQMAEFNSKQSQELDSDTGESTEKEDVIENNNFKLYVSDIELINNCMLVNIGSSQAVYLSHFSFSTMFTKNDSYCKKTEVWLNNIVKKSTLISGVSEKQRFQFFLNMNKEIDDLMKRINEDIS